MKACRSEIRANKRKIINQISKSGCASLVCGREWSVVSTLFACCMDVMWRKLQATICSQHKEKSIVCPTNIGNVAFRLADNAQSEWNFHSRHNSKWPFMRFQMPIRMEPLVSDFFLPLLSRINYYSFESKCWTLRTNLKSKNLIKIFFPFLFSFFFSFGWLVVGLFMATDGNTEWNSKGTYIKSK